MCVHVLQSSLDRKRSDISSLVDYYYYSSPNWQLLYVYGHTYLSTRAHIIDWFEEAERRKTKLGKKTRKTFERWGVKDDIGPERYQYVYIHTHISIHSDKKQWIGAWILLHCIIITIATTIYQCWESKKMSILDYLYFHLYEILISVTGTTKIISILLFFLPYGILFLF